MSLSIRPPESANVDADLRTRMEGGVEALEDALALLDAAARAVQRGVQHADDVATVREVVNQLPRLDRHAERLVTEPTAEALVRRYTQLKHALEALTGGPSLRDGLSRLVVQRAVAAVAPADDETILLDAPTETAWLRGWAGAAVVALLAFFASAPWLLLGVPILLAVLAYFIPRRRWFAVQPHRLFMTRRFNHGPREALWRDAPTVERHGTFFRTRAGSTELPLSPANDQLFAAWVSLLTGAWLRGLSQTSQEVVSQRARIDGGHEGTVFITREGVLFVPDVTQDLVARKLAVDHLAVLPPWDKLIDALTHLPREKWRDLGPYLAISCDGAWLSTGSFTVDDASPTVVRLSGSTRANEETTGARGRWSLVQLSLEPRARGAARELLEATKSQAT